MSILTKAKPVSETVKDCHYPWTWLLLTTDGAVRPCCFAPGEIGNLSDAADVEEIWNGPVAIALRAPIKRDEIHPVCKGAFCKFVQNMGAAKSDSN
jgi:MoaA/NifB/PqqE/SkfB family radical SAM enzyme